MAFWVRELEDKASPYVVLAYADEPSIRKCKSLVDDADYLYGLDHSRGTPIAWSNDEAYTIHAGRYVYAPLADRVVRKIDIPWQDYDRLLAARNGKTIAALQLVGGESLRIAFFDAKKAKQLPGGIEGFAMGGVGRGGLLNWDGTSYTSGAYGYCPWQSRDEFAFLDAVWGLPKAERLRPAPPSSTTLFSPSGKYSARVENPSLLRIRDAKTKKKVCDIDEDVIKANTGNVIVSWSADESRIAVLFPTNEQVNTLRVVSLKDEKMLAVWKNAVYMTHIAISPDGKRIAGLSRNVVIYEIGIDKPRDLEGGLSDVHIPGWSVDGSEVYSTYGHLYAFSATTGKLLRRTPAPNIGYSRRPSSAAWIVCMFPSGVRFWNMETGATAGSILRLRSQPTPVDVIVSPEGHYKAFGLGADDLMIYIAETDAGELFALSPKEFAAKFGWRNNPTKVKIEMPEPKVVK